MNNVIKNSQNGSAGAAALGKVVCEICGKEFTPKMAHHAKYCKACKKNKYSEYVQNRLFNYRGLKYNEQKRLNNGETMESIYRPKGTFSKSTWNKSSIEQKKEILNTPVEEGFIKNPSKCLHPDHSIFKGKNKYNVKCGNCPSKCHYITVDISIENTITPVLYDEYDSSEPTNKTKKPMKARYNTKLATKEYTKNNFTLYKQEVYRKYKNSLGTEDPKTYNNSDRFGFEDIRKACLKRANYQSELTGSTKGKLVVHHINSWDIHPDERYDMDNLIVLTESEHKLFHSIYHYGKNTREQWNEFIKDY